MRMVPDDLVARLESGAATLCHAWLMTRVDGVVTGYTDHDRDLEIEGVPCRAGRGWTGGAAESAVGLAAGSAAIGGVLDDDGITEADLVAGLYDGAEVTLWRVDWSRPELKVRLWMARLVRLQREGAQFLATLEGPMAALEKVVGRTYGRDCDARFGDARCGVNLANYPGQSCDKRWRTCTGSFDNGHNFRGFPDIPGDDFLLAAPMPGGRHDGRSRS